MDVLRGEVPVQNLQNRWDLHGMPRRQHFCPKVAQKKVPRLVGTSAWNTGTKTML